MYTYTETEMLNLYRNSLGLSRVLTLPAANERQPLDRELLQVLHSRYRTLLATQKPELLPVVNAGDEVDLLPEPELGFMRIPLPDYCVRPVSLWLPGWPQRVYRFHQAGCALHRRQRYALLRATEFSPVVFRSADELIVYGLPARYTVQQSCELRVVAAPADGSFRLDESLLPILLK